MVTVWVEEREAQVADAGDADDQFWLPVAATAREIG